jgi:voltage-gated potassium channel
MLLGIALFAVPAGIMATGFAGELRRRDFVVTWKTVAKLPLFAGLDAGRIASIAQLLQPQFVPPGQVIVRRGAAADAMYFLMEGEAEVDVEPNRVRLRSGSYFGEIALLRDCERTATVTAITECRLLALSVADFRRLMAELPDLREKLESVAGARLGDPGQ